MSEEVQSKEEVNPIEQLKLDMRKEFDEFKLSVQKEMDEKDAKIKELTENNDQLRASLVRNTFTEPVPEPKEPTPEELYQAEVSKYAEKTLTRMKQELIG